MRPERRLSSLLGWAGEFLSCGSLPILFAASEVPPLRVDGQRVHFSAAHFTENTRLAGGCGWRIGGTLAAGGGRPESYPSENHGTRRIIPLSTRWTSPPVASCTRQVDSENHGGRKRWDRETKFVRGGGVGHDERRENRRFTGGARWNPMSPSGFEPGPARRSAHCGQRAPPMLRGAGRLGCEGSASDAFQSRAVARDRRRRQDHVERIPGFLDGEFLQRLVIKLHVDPL